MTSAQTMLANRFNPIARGAVLALCLVSMANWGCETLPSAKPKLTPPTVTVAPYDATGGEVLWAVLPLANESGTEFFDPLVVSDKLVAAVEEIQGVRALPLNRTLQAMHALEMRDVTDPGDVRRLATAMGVDGVLLGTITAYDPYDPPTFGLSLALYARTGAMNGSEPESPIDPRSLAAAPTDTAPGTRLHWGDAPTAVASAHLDARDHSVLQSLSNYATGRHDPDSALTWKRYTASMDLYTQFATQHLVSMLIQQEQLRLAALQENEDPPPP